MAQDSAQAVKVVARFRPLNKLELTKGSKVCIGNLTKEGVQLKTQDGSAYQFSFDRVFGTTSSQLDVWDEVGKPIVGSLFQGFNGCLLAYGQTGSGKTHTMMGPAMAVEDDSVKGIIPRAVDAIFAAALAADESCEFRIQVSFVEIYQEHIRDLLSPTTPGSDNLQVGEELDGGVYIKGVAEFFVTSPEEMLDLMNQGNENRAVSATGMNAGSSRSHSLFLISLTQSNRGTGVSTSGKLYLVDLAGSETVSKTGVGGVQLEELKKINKSLSALGLVINALTDGKSTHVPYRDSKLTRVLQECLGGNARTALIIACSPSAWNEMETLSTLRFGKRAKRITNHAHVNKELTPDEMKRHISVLEAVAAAFLGAGRDLVRLHASGSVGAQLPCARCAAAPVATPGELAAAGEVAAVVAATAAAVAEATAALAGTTLPAPVMPKAPRHPDHPEARRDSSAAVGGVEEAAPQGGPDASSGSGGAGAEGGVEGLNGAPAPSPAPEPTPGAADAEPGTSGGPADGDLGAPAALSLSEFARDDAPFQSPAADDAAASAALVADAAASAAAADALVADDAAASAARLSSLEAEHASLNELLAEAGLELSLMRTALEEVREREREAAGRVADLTAMAEERDERIANLTSLLAATRVAMDAGAAPAAAAAAAVAAQGEGEGFAAAPMAGEQALQPPTSDSGEVVESAPAAPSAVAESADVAAAEAPATSTRGDSVPDGATPAAITPPAAPSAAAEELDMVRGNYRRALAENEELRAELQDLTTRLAAAERAQAAAAGEGEAAPATATEAAPSPRAPASARSPVASSSASSRAAVAALSLLHAVNAAAAHDAAAAAAEDGAPPKPSSARPSADSTRIAAAAMDALGLRAEARDAITAASAALGQPPTADGAAPAAVASAVPKKEGAPEAAAALRVTEYTVLWEHQRLDATSGTWSSRLALPRDPPAWQVAPDAAAAASAASPSASSDGAPSSAAASFRRSSLGGAGVAASSGVGVASRDEVALPSPEWYWTGEWEVDYGPDNAGHATLGNSSPPERDGAGWQYGSSFASLAGFRAGGHPRGVRTPSDAVKRRRWVRARARVDVSSPAAASAHLLQLTARLEMQDDLLVRMTDELGRRSKQIEDYENKLQDVLQQMAAASATGDLRYIGGSTIGVNGARILGAPGQTPGGAARTIRGRATGGRTSEGGVGAASSPGAPAQHHSYASGASPGGGLLSYHDVEHGGAGGGGGSILDSIGRYWRRLSAMPASMALSPVTSASSAAAGASSPGGHQSYTSVQGGPVGGGRPIPQMATAAPAAAPSGQAPSLAATGRVVRSGPAVGGAAPTASAAGASMAAHASSSAAGAQQLLATLFQAAEAGEEDKVEACLRTPNASTTLMKAQDKLGRTAYLYAARGGRLRICQLLLARGADSFASDNDGRNALHYAARRGHVELASWLLSLGLPVRQADVHALTALHHATLGKSPPMVRLLLQSGADPAAVDANGSTPGDLASQLAADDPAADAVRQELQQPAVDGPTVAR